MAYTQAFTLSLGNRIFIFQIQHTEVLKAAVDPFVSCAAGLDVVYIEIRLFLYGEYDQKYILTFSGDLCVA